VQTGENRWSTDIDGDRREQRALQYQAKRLVWINEAYTAPRDQGRAGVDDILELSVGAVLNL
jgi:hypothetical protein